MARRVLLLDLDGTLVDSVPDLRSSLNRLMERRGLAPFTTAEVAAMVGDGAAALVRKAMHARVRAAEPEDLDLLLADYMAHVATLTRPYADGPETLDLLRASGWRLAVCTNKPEAAARKLLAALGLLPRFDAVAGGDIYAARKPDPLHIVGLLQSMGAGADDAVMVGDHHNDVAAAQGAGVPCIFAAWGYGEVKMGREAGGIATRFADLPAVLDRM